MVMSFDLDAGKSFGHGLEELAKAHFDHDASRSSSCAARARSRSRFDKVPLRAGDRICRRGCRHLPPAMAAAEAAASPKRMSLGSMSASTSRWCRSIGRMERRGIRVDREYLARLSREFAERDRDARGTHLRGGVRPLHHRLAATVGRSALRPARPQGRAQGQERAIFDRRQRARAARRRRRSTAPGWCSTGAS